MVVAVAPPSEKDLTQHKISMQARATDQVIQVAPSLNAAAKMTNTPTNDDHL